MSPNFIIRPATPSDVLAITHIEFEACASDPGFSTIFPLGATPASVAWAAKHFGDRITSGDPSSVSLIAISVQTGEIASDAQWQFFEVERGQASVDEEMLASEFGLPEDANVAVGNRLIANGTRKRHEIMGTRAYAYFASIGTKRQYQKQGAASMLMEAFIQQTDEKGLEAYIEGTSVAVGLYRKYGFEEVDRLRLDLKPWKAGDYFNSCMIRPARRKEA